MKIWKFPLAITDRQTVIMPAGTKILTIQAQDGFPQIWALVNESSDQKQARKFVTYGTGHAITEDPGTYIATYQVNNGELVFHVFETN